MDKAEKQNSDAINKQVETDPRKPVGTQPSFLQMCKRTCIDVFAPPLGAGFRPSSFTCYSPHRVYHQKPE